MARHLIDPTSRDFTKEYDNLYFLDQIASVLDPKAQMLFISHIFSVIQKIKTDIDFSNRNSTDSPFSVTPLVVGFSISYNALIHPETTELPIEIFTENEERDIIEMRITKKTRRSTVTTLSSSMAAAAVAAASASSSTNTDRLSGIERTGSGSGIGGHVTGRERSGSGLLNRFSAINGSNSNSNLSSNSSWTLNLDSIELTLNIFCPYSALCKYSPKPQRCPPRSFNFIKAIAKLWKTRSSRFYAYKENWTPIIMCAIMSELIILKGYHLYEIIEAAKSQLNIKILQEKIRKIKSSLPLPTDSVEEMKQRIENGLPVAFYSRVEAPSTIEISNKDGKGFSSLIEAAYCVSPLWVIRKVDEELIRYEKSSRSTTTLNEILQRLTSMHYFATFVTFFEREKADRETSYIVAQYHLEGSSNGEPMDTTTEYRAALVVPTLSRLPSPRQGIDLKDRKDLRDLKEEEALSSEKSPARGSLPGLKFLSTTNKKKEKKDG